ncbi:hypothetical protein GCM10022408_13440 [Hymenobacter fastidiosus]|uniref:LemA family protein n=1 Tax=Hymenobacter fastidiosus TaxID=486264 RepID=A0ABP7RWD6_9BACT
MDNLTSTLLTALLNATVMGAIVTALVNLLFKARFERIATDIKSQSEQIGLIYRSQYTWREQSLSELLGPINILLSRTEKAFKRLGPHNTFVEARILKESNEKIRDLLLQKSHLTPASLSGDALALIEHFDRYLEEFEKLRGGQAPAAEAPFVFVGPAGFPFPRQAADNFQAEYQSMWQQVYGHRG